MRELKSAIIREVMEAELTGPRATQGPIQSAVSLIHKHVELNGQVVTSGYSIEIL